MVSTLKEPHQYRFTISGSTSVNNIFSKANLFERHCEFNFNSFRVSSLILRKLGDEVIIGQAASEVSAEKTGERWLYFANLIH